MVKLKHEWTRDTGLYGDDNAIPCVMSTGQIIIYGKEFSQRGYKFYFFNPDGTSTGCPVVKSICQHANQYYSPHDLLPIIIGSTEYIAVSCTECKMIRLINPDYPRREPVVAYTGSKEGIWCMCLGQTGTLYFVDVNSGQVLLLDCTTTTFSLKRRLCKNYDFRPYCICYIEDENLIVLISWFYSRICAVRISDGQKVWDKSIQAVEGKEWRPHGLASLQDPGLLFVGDQRNRRIIIQSPVNGDILQILPLTEITGWIRGLHLINNKLLVHYFENLSCWSVGIIN